MGHSVQHTEALCEEEPSLDRKRWSAFRGLPLLFRDQVLSFFNTLYVRPQNNLVEIETPEIKCPARVLPQHKLQFIAPVLGVTFKKGTRTRGGGEGKDFLWAYYGGSVFYSSHAKRKKRPLWNSLYQFGTHTKQFYFRAFSKLFRWMLPNKGNLHWKFLQEHKPFHVSQPGFLAFISVLPLLLFWCPQPIFLLPTLHRLPLTSAIPNSVQHQNPLRNFCVVTVSLPWYKDPDIQYPGFNRGAYF